MYNRNFLTPAISSILATKYEITHKSVPSTVIRNLNGQGRENAKASLPATKSSKALEKDVLDLIAKMKKDEDAANSVPLKVVNHHRSTRRK
jgi:hypothetical protein